MEGEDAKDGEFDLHDDDDNSNADKDVD